MKKLYYIFLLLILFVIGFTSCEEDLNTVGPEITTPARLAPDGPYFLDTDKGVRMICIGGDFRLKDTVYTTLPENFSFDVYSDTGEDLFQVKLKKENRIFPRPVWKSTKQYNKTFVASDLHGRIDLMTAILKTGEVIDEKCNWIFGDNHLVLVGDMFDRGRDATPIFWLIYKLETEAEAAGGEVTLILGDHEEMVLRNNLKYTLDKYGFLADFLGMTYNSLWNGKSLLGRWLQSKNSIQIVGDNLYVHAGLSNEFIERTEDGMTIENMNQKIGDNLPFLQAERESNLGKDLSRFLFNDSYFGPLWYRGMVKTSSKYEPIKDKAVGKLLETYGVKRIIVGHTELKEVGYIKAYNKKVYCVNVNHPTAFKDKKSRAMLITGDDLKALNDEGEYIDVPQGKEA